MQTIKNLKNMTLDNLDRCLLVGIVLTVLSYLIIFMMETVDFSSLLPAGLPVEQVLKFIFNTFIEKTVKRGIESLSMFVE